MPRGHWVRGSWCIGRFLSGSPRNVYRRAVSRRRLSFAGADYFAEVRSWAFIGPTVDGTPKRKESWKYHAKAFDVSVLSVLTAFGSSVSLDGAHVFCETKCLQPRISSWALSVGCLIVRIRLVLCFEGRFRSRYSGRVVAMIISHSRWCFKGKTSDS